ncbi:family 6 glucosyltransferase [Bacteroides reticulotermitis]|uniref:Glycoprotein galactosyltransferase n=2 Tax=Bacteroides reticulotermitis TaxID=1133319 RepID=W4UP70_9BACE|nr:family 6 glucosyltransferase [Bacteroides reticulotermitis]MBB4044038.1 hypothetical protein [Bacteroides reticulotermitis]GAE82622.1 glycoprotein galactosyltransferase [Bacteroides reticulotermitis JCM 10512]
MRIGILYICTGKYSIFWKDFYLSAERYLMQSPAYTREYYVFTDSLKLYDEENNKHIHRIKQKNLGWPDNTLKRFHMFLQIKQQLLQETDFLIFCNANLLFKQNVGHEIIPQKGKNQFVGTIHPGFYNSHNYDFTYERRHNSKAYIPEGEGVHYYAGGFSGGYTKAYLQLCETIKSWVDIDKSNKIVAIWHDESHINRYFLKNPPLTLSPGYLYPEGWSIPFEEIITIRDKNKEEYGGHILLRKKESWRNKILKIIKKTLFPLP